MAPGLLDNPDDEEGSYGTNSRALGILGYLPDDNAPLFLQAGMAPTPPSSFPLMLPAAPVPYPSSGDTWGAANPWGANNWGAANTSAANTWAAPNAAAGPWPGQYLAPVPAAPDWGQVPTTPTANQAAIFATPQPLSWNDAAQNSPGDYWRDFSSNPLFRRSAVLPTPPTGRTGPDFNTMTPAEIYTYRMQQSARPTFGRGEGPMLAAVTSAADPFGIPSWLVGLVSPETRDKIRDQYENNPTAALVGSLATPTPRSVVTAITAAPKTVATLLGLGAVMAPDDAEAALGSFTGKTFPWKLLEKARNMTKAGHSAEDIWRATGLEPGALENKFDPKAWLYEMTDKGYHVRPKVGWPDNQEYRYYLAPLYEHHVHPALQEAYPQLADVISRLKIDPYAAKAEASFNRANRTVTILARDLEEARSLGTHELMHVVQQLEKLPHGGNPQWLVDQGWTSPAADLLYKRLVGETQARNAQGRLMLREAERRERPPSKTEDEARDDQMRNF